MKNYEAVIGLEVHVQLKTKSKMFCSSSADYFGATPNSYVCEVCLGLPGALPVINEKALKSAIKIGLALNCQISENTRFDRKNYFYPDLAKGFQISQFDKPVSKTGWIMVGEKKVRVNRAHLEEDTGKLIHATVNEERVSLVDFNRSGVPLLEIVSEPDLSSPEEAKEYAKKLHLILRYLGVADADMEKAGMRFDANVSIREKGETALGVKVEVKNINSFRFLERALIFEIERQKNLVESGEKIIQETRGWVETKGETVSQRSKEYAQEYRYFPEPDLPGVEIAEELIESLRKELPELPDQKTERLAKEYSLTPEEARLLCEEKELADFFEAAATEFLKIFKGSPKEVVNWILGEVKRVLNQEKISIKEAKLEPAALVELILLVKKGEISNLIAKEVLKEVFQTGLRPSKIVKEKGLVVKGPEELESIVLEVLEENPKAVADYKSGKEAAVSFLLGTLMRKLKGQVNPDQALPLLKEKLKNE